MPHQGNHIGTLIKTHGYQGELILKGKARVLENLTSGTPMFIEIYEQRVPFFITDLSIEKSGERGVIKFEFIDSDNEAKRFVGCDVFNEADFSNKNERDISFRNLIGFKVSDYGSGKEFKVVDYYDNPENPILVLDNMGKELLLPANADYIKSIDHKNHLIKAEFPEGLMME